MTSQGLGRWPRRTDLAWQVHTLLARCCRVHEPCSILCGLYLPFGGRRWMFPGLGHASCSANFSRNFSPCWQAQRLPARVYFSRVLRRRLPGFACVPRNAWLYLKSYILRSLIFAIRWLAYCCQFLPCCIIATEFAKTLQSPGNSP